MTDQPDTTRAQSPHRRTRSFAHRLVEALSGGGSLERDQMTAAKDVPMGNTDVMAGITAPPGYVPDGYDEHRPRH